MLTVNNTASKMTWGNYARVLEHTGKVVKKQINYSVIDRPVKVERPMIQDMTTNITIENQFEIYV